TIHGREQIEDDPAGMLEWQTGNGSFILFPSLELGLRYTFRSAACAPPSARSLSTSSRNFSISAFWARQRYSSRSAYSFKSVCCWASMGQHTTPERKRRSVS